jgi:FtsP/CotA-like multicopper oxidase with cupredoxin domain
MLARVTKPIGSGLALLVIATLLLSGSALATSAPAPRQAPAAAPLTSHTPVTWEYHLCATEGSVTMPDSEVITIWGFSVDSDTGPGASCGPAQVPGPELDDATAGDTIVINLYNDLDEPVAINFPGQTDPALLPPDATGAPPGGTTSYTFEVPNPGTYLYQSGTNAGIQTAMGLYGALIVRPDGFPDQAYDDASTAFDVEKVLVLSEFDDELNNLSDPNDFDWAEYHPVYWLINGEAYPDTDPISAGEGEKVLLRYLNAGLTHQTMELLGAHQRVIARDAHPLPAPFDAVSEIIPAGQTTDAIATMPPGSEGSEFPLFSRTLYLTNGNFPDFPGGMLTFIEVGMPPPPPVDTPPTVDAGVDDTITLPATASLNGTVTDDGVSALSTLWTQTSGPGTVTFGDDTAVDTTASFSIDGVYVLRLTATDGTGPVFDEVTITVNPAPGPTTLTLQVGASSDDVNQDANTLELAFFTVWLGNGSSTTASYTGLRFTNVTIPPGATITAAHVEVYANTMQWISMNMALAAEAVGNSPTFSTNNQPSQRTLTSAQVNHSSNVQWLAGTWYSLDDLTPVIQEVVNRGDWANGNSLSVILKGTNGQWGRKYVESYDGTPANAPKLVITYTTP